MSYFINDIKSAHIRPSLETLVVCRFLDVGLESIDIMQCRGRVERQPIRPVTINRPILLMTLVKVGVSITSKSMIEVV